MRRVAIWASALCAVACSSGGGSPSASQSTTPPTSMDASGGDDASIDASVPPNDAGAAPSSDATTKGNSDAAQPPPPGADGAIPSMDASLHDQSAPPPPPVDGGSTTPWTSYILAPPTRTVAPVSVSASGTAGDAGAYTGQTLRLNGSGASATFDFGKEVAGIVSLTFASASDTAQAVGLSFSESSQYVGPASDLSTGGPGVIDGALAAHVTAASTYTMPASWLRGGFRYLTVSLTTAGWVDVAGVSLNFTAAPAMSAPNQYLNYFYSSDDLLNRIWYAGAYTVQLDTIDPKQGRVWPAPDAGWDNAGTVGSGSSVLVDGAKRDRTVWAGDLGVAVPTAFVSTGDMASTKNSLDTLFAGQDTTTGEFPRSGPPLNGQNGHTTSDTYHMWTLVGAYNYFLYSGDKTWLDKNWAAHKKGVSFVTAKIDANNLLNVTLTKDWGRLGQGGENIAANAILYRVLVSSAQLATVEGDSASATYTMQAAALKTAANASLWDATAGAYRDSPTSAVYPQDGNALAVWFGLVDSPAKSQAIAAALRKNWNAFGSHTPEGDPTRATISPFPGSMEVAARFVGGDDQGALDLIRLEWGYMLGAPTGTASTFWEGYLDDGTFGYGGSYMSTAHGWSSGPTFAMTQWLLGVAPDSAGGQAYHVIPHAGDVTHAEGSLSVGAGKALLVSFDHPACGDFTLHLDSSSVAGSAGVVGIPKFGQSRVVQVDGATVWDGTQYVASAKATSADQDSGYVYLRGVVPTKSVFTYSPKQCP